jgi:hypothetical protein
MSFANSAEEVRLNEENGHVLVAKLYDANGELKDAEIDLDDYIGNDDGAYPIHTRHSVSNSVKDTSSGEPKVHATSISISGLADVWKGSQNLQRKSPSTLRERPTFLFCALFSGTRMGTMSPATLTLESASTTQMGHLNLVRVLHFPLIDLADTGLQCKSTL